MSEFYDARECRDPQEREEALMHALPGQVAYAQSQTSGFAKILDGVDAEAVTDRAALAQLPVTRKSDLIALQAENMPFGGLNATPAGQMRRLFVSPGPIVEPQGTSPDWFRFARALFAAGVRAGDIVQNCFSYHFTPAGFMMEDAATKIGAAVVPAGVGNTDAQVDAIAHFQCSVYAGTPDFLKIILERADEKDIDLSCIKKAVVGGGALFPALRESYAARGIETLQSYGSADCGLIAYESSAKEGLILDEDVIVELVRPGTNDVVEEGDVGEVVVTLLNPDYPLIRFGTGDLSAFLPGQSPCGRTAPRLKGWMGRADQTTKVRGMFVHPGQIDKVIKEFGGIKKARLIVGHENGRDTAKLVCERADGDMVAMDRLISAFADACKVRVGVQFVGIGDLPNDGKVIDDTRSYE